MEIDPGPTKRGVPMGTMRSRNRARASSNDERSFLSALNRSMIRVLPWIIPSPVLKRRIPPAIWKAGIEIPKKLRTGDPMARQSQRAVTVKILMTRAMDLWTLARVPSLMARKTGMMLNGLRTAKIAARAVRKNWSDPAGMGLFWMVRFRGPWV